MDDLASHDFSTVIDTDPSPSASGGGQMDIAEPQAPEPKEQEAPRSARADLEHVFKAEDKKAAEAEKPKDPVKEAKADDKADDDEDDASARETKAPSGRTETPAAKPEGEEKVPDKPQDGKRHIDAPKSFLPKAREVWRNTPRDVQTEVERMVRDHEEQVQRFSETSQRYESIRHYDELARSNGRDLKDSLEQVHQLENLMATNPIAGVNAILMQAGPRKADGQPISLYELAQHIVQSGPQSYQQMVQQAQQQPQQQQPNREVEELRQQVQAMQQEQLANQIIAPFRAANPRYDELQEDIAFFLQSGRIPASLSLQERLAAAYDMAERINPASYVETRSEPDSGPAPERRADDGLSGTKSIRSAPGSVSEDVEVKPREGESSRDSLMAELRRMNRR